VVEGAVASAASAESDGVVARVEQAARDRKTHVAQPDEPDVSVGTILGEIVTVLLRE
jgi:hypothetical protein